MSNDKQASSPGFSGRLVLVAIDALGMLPLPLARWLGIGLGRLAWLLKTREAKVTLRNLALCFPDMEEPMRKALAKKSLCHTGMLALEIFVLRKRDQQWLKRKIVAVHDEPIKQALLKQKGVIVLAPHIGNWEVFSRILTDYGNLTALYQVPKRPYLEKVIVEARQKSGGEVYPTTRKGVLKVINSVKNGGVTGILPDQNPGEGSGAFAPFFGRPAYTMTLVHGIIQRIHCPVVFGVVKRVPQGFEVHFFDASEDIYAEDTATSLRGLNKGVEDSITYCPEQYQWEYKRFRVRPEGEPDPYSFTS